MPRLFSILLGSWKASGNGAAGPAGAPLPSLPSPLFGTQPYSPLEPTVCSSFNAGASRQEWWEEKLCQLHVSESPSICICQRNKKKINARKRQLRWGCGGTAADSLPLSSKGLANHASEPQIPVVTFRMQAMALRRPFCHRAAARLGQGQSRRQAGDWYRGRTAPAHIPADPNKGTAVRAARAQAPPPRAAAPPPSPSTGWRPPRPRPRITCRPGLPRLPLDACYFFFSLSLPYFPRPAPPAINVLWFNVYEICSAAGRNLGPAGERKRPFFSIRSPLADQRTPCRHSSF